MGTEISCRSFLAESLPWALPVPESDHAVRRHVQRKGIGAARFCTGPTPNQDVYPSQTESLAFGM